MSDAATTNLGELLDELDGPPTLAGLLDLLDYGLQSLDPDTASDLGSGPLTAKTKSGKQEADGSESDARDAAYQAAVDLFHEVADELTGSPPSLKDILAAIVDALHELDDDALDGIAPADIKSLAPASTKQQKKVKPGDLLAIPVGSGQRLAIVLETGSSLGLGVGLFEAAPVARASSAPSLEPLKHPVFTADDAIKSGRWRVVGHDDSLVDKFPTPEIFHRPRDDSDDPVRGRYGAGETSDGDMRKLDKAEAEELGLLDGSYSQGLQADELERLLAD